MVTIEHFSRLVHEIYDAAVDPNHWTAALEEVSSAVGATGCALLTTDPEHNEISVRSSGADPASVTTYNEYFGRLDRAGRFSPFRRAARVTALRARRRRPSPG